MAPGEKSMRQLFIAAAALLLAGTAHARTIEVAAGADAQTRLQEALILAEPGDVVMLGAVPLEGTADTEHHPGAPDGRRLVPSDEPGQCHHGEGRSDHWPQQRPSRTTRASRWP